MTQSIENRLRDEGESIDDGREIELEREGGRRFELQRGERGVSVKNKCEVRTRKGSWLLTEEIRDTIRPKEDSIDKNLALYSITLQYGGKMDNEVINYYFSMNDTKNR